MSDALPAKYYLKAKDPKHAALVAGVVFLDFRSPWRWLAKESGRDLRDKFTVEEVKVVYYGSNLESDFT